MLWLVLQCWFLLAAMQASSTAQRFREKKHKRLSSAEEKMCIKGNNWCAHIAGSTTCYTKADKTRRETFFVERNFSISDDDDDDRRRFSSRSDLITALCRLHSSLDALNDGQQWRKREKGERKDQSCAIGRQTTRNAKKVGPEVKDQRISNFNCCSPAFCLQLFCGLCFALRSENKWPVSPLSH